MSASARILDDDSAGPAVGALQVGTETAAQSGPDQWHGVSFDQAIPGAIVVMGPLSLNDGAPASVRVRNVTDTGFEWQIDEWDYLDGVHGAETISWMAMSAGTYRLADGTVVHAGQTQLVNQRLDPVALEGFDAAPLVFAQVTSANDGASVGTRILNVTAGGFDIQMREEEAADGVHGAERVDYIALEPGGSVLPTGVTPNAVTHTGYTIDPAGDEFAFLAGMQTRNGADHATLRYEDVPGGVRVLVDEEQSANAETGHGPETVAWIEAQTGTLDLFAVDPPIA